ncbi:hypothetical protein [Kitasatospora sp. NPDC059571]|uniref:hypothetical protein n=1 Tax=Kitasatospora sp. NPDC059571 TaxID=3346871 RepID=UPI003693BDCE
MSSTSRASAVVFDPAAAIPELAAVRQAAERGDWPAVGALFAGCAEEEGRMVLADEVAGTAGAEHLLARVLEVRPNDPLATALLADRHIHLGWDARTSRRAQDVTAEGWQGFRHHLNRAEQLLIGAVARDRGHAMAWSLRITVAMGLSLGQSEARRRQRCLSLASPHHYDGQRRLLQQLLPKWGGSWDAAHAFVHESVRAAPPGSICGALVARYHVERLEELGRQDRLAYAARPDVRHELAGAAAASVLHPACRVRYGLITAHSMFALLASLAGDPAAAALHFRAMGPYGSTYPWGILGGQPEETFAEHRARALGRG